MESSGTNSQKPLYFLLLSNIVTDKDHPKLSFISNLLLLLLIYVDKLMGIPLLDSSWNRFPH